METNNNSVQTGGKDMNATTLDLMSKMHLNGMRDAFKNSLGSTFAENMTPDAFIASLISSEWDYRNEKMVLRLTKQAGFRYNALIEDIDYKFSRGLDRNQIERLASLDFIRDSQNVIITGPSGIGKSYFATGYGREACKNGIRTLYANTQKLMNKLKGAKAKGTYEQVLLVMDAVGLAAFTITGIAVAETVSYSNWFLSLFVGVDDGRAAVLQDRRAMVLLGIRILPGGTS